MCYCPSADLERASKWAIRLSLSSDTLAIFSASACDMPRMPLNSLIVAIEPTRLSARIASLIAHAD